LAPLAQLANPGDQFERNVVLGEIRPLLPDKAALLPAWQELSQAGGSASRSQRLTLRHLVGPDVDLNRDGCLRVPDTPGMQRAVELWLRASGRETSPFWREASISLPTLLGSREPPATRGVAIFVLNDAWAVSYDYGFTHVRTPRPDALCLVELTADRKQAILSAMIKATRCQLTDATDALRWPRPVLPPFEARSIAAAAGRICAADSHGRWICCGKAGPDRPLAHAKASALSDQRDYGCALDASGQASCWGQEDGSGRTRPPRGAVRSIESAPTYSCAIDERTNVTCWGALTSTAPSPYTTFRDRWNASLNRQRDHH
jgi:hypothetical protein